MLFTSLEFILFFLPIVLIVGLLLPTKVQNYWLFAESIFFYAWGEPAFVVIMLASIGANWLLALVLDKVRNHAAVSKTILGAGMIFNLGILFVYKYMNFVTSLIHDVNESVAVTEYILPIGISFYTFQALSYVIDVYRGEKAQKNIFHVGLYIALFPQLIAGPIVRYGDIKEQILTRKRSLGGFADGMYKFLIGFNKKMMLANVMAIVADAAFNADTRTALMGWLGALCYTLQIYFDFSGYSDMAIGLGKLFGFNIPKNFDYPYISKTVTEFWRRWHMSLGTWFRDYLYFPLGGSRVSGKGRLIFNLLFVWLMTGIWHGANWTFILWGVIYGVLISIEKYFSVPEKVKASKAKSGGYQVFTMLAVMFGWVLFRAEHLKAALHYVLDMFGLRAGGLAAAADVFYLREYGLYIVAAIIFSLPVVDAVKARLEKKHAKLYALVDAVMYLANIALFVVGISYLVISAHNPFIYFNF